MKHTALFTLICLLFRPAIAQEKVVYVQLKSTGGRSAQWLSTLPPNANAQVFGGALSASALNASLEANARAQSAVSKMARTVVLRYPAVVPDQAIAARLRANSDIAGFAKQRPLKFAFTPPDPYYSLIPTGNWVHPNTSSTSLPKNPLANAVTSSNSNQASSIKQYGLDQIDALDAWDLVGTGISSNYHGTASLAMLDFGIAPGCDSFNPVGANCIGASKYHPDLMPNLRENLSAGLDFYDNSAGGTASPVTQSVLEYQAFNSVELLSNLPAFRLEGNPMRPFLLSAPSTRLARTGHGTHVAGIMAAAVNGQGVAGTCPTCSLAVYKSETNIISMTGLLRLATGHGAQAVNLSFTLDLPVAAEEQVLFWEPEGPVDPLALEMQAAAERDIWVVQSIGNDRSPDFISNTSVVYAGATDFEGVFWNESRLEPNDTRCAMPGPEMFCGSNFPDASTTPSSNGVNHRFLLAPGARILSTIYTNWISRYAYNRAACTSELYPQDATSTSTQNYNSRYGLCTGTSMSAPFITAAGGLVRSVNPLISRENMLRNFNFTGTAVTHPQPTVNNSAATNTAKRIDAFKAVERALGQIAGSAETNRVTPLFSARASTQIINGSGTTQSTTDWLYSSKPQSLVAAANSELYFVSFAETSPTSPAGQKFRANYNVNLTNLPPVPGYLYPSFSSATPRASAYLFTTQKVPYPGAPSNLIPLQRLSVQGRCQIRKHVYTSPKLTGTLSFSSLTTSGTACSSTIDNPTLTTAKYDLVSVEGFMFNTQEPGTVALSLKYHPGQNAFALMTPADVGRGEYNGYVDPPGGAAVLGYVYENDTAQVGKDTDIWPNAWERAVGLNDEATDSDCDNLSDSAEYPFTDVGLGDPMQSTNCADLRMQKNVISNSQIDVTLKNPVGPTAASAPTVTFGYAGNTLQNPIALLSPVVAGWTCSPGVFTFLPQNNFTATVTCSGPASLAVGAQVNFSLAAKLNKFLPVEATAGHAGPDPAPTNNLAN
jgi:hypothetical protein